MGPGWLVWYVMVILHRLLRFRLDTLKLVRSSRSEGLISWDTWGIDRILSISAV